MTSSFKCDLCKSLFKCWKSMLRHKRTIHRSDTKILFNSKEKSLYSLRFICDSCKRSYSNKHSLREHLKICFFGENSFKCDVCNSEFKYRKSMLHHKRTIHTKIPLNLKANSVTDLKFICDICQNEFKYKRSMLHHKRTIHSKITLNSKENSVSYLNFVCDSCKRCYSSKHSLREHLKRCFFGQNNFKCDVCKCKFKYKNSMLRHKRTIHPKIHLNSQGDFVSNLKFSCNSCKRFYSRKDVMLSHIKKCFFGDTKVCLLECDTCKKKFTRMDLLRRHCSRHLLIDSNVKCAECASIPSMLNVCNRILMEYDTELNHEHHEFASENDFYKWKENLEKSTITFYRKRYVRKFKQKTTYRFICHRSGTYISKSQGKREIKLYGSKKVGKCPAEIRLYKDNETGLCKGLYINTHLGHDINNKKDELRHICHKEEDHLLIGSKIMLGVPFKISTATTDSPSNNSNFESLYLLNKDLLKIKPSVTAPQFPDSVDIETFVSKHSNSIIYYKKQNELDVSLPTLSLEDTIIIMMTNSQKECLKKYGQNIIIVDGTHEVTMCTQFLMHTMLVMDDSNREIEVAFAIANRNDEMLAFVMFCCIKEIIGVIHTRVLMTDIQESYYTSWRNVMGEPQFRLFCTWHVKEDWQKNLKKIPTVNKRNHVRNQLYKIFSSLDENIFLAELNEFISDKDPDLEKFITYFNTYYVKKVEAWAYCYRKNANINKNMCFETFHMLLNKAIRKSNHQKVPLNICLKLLNKYLEEKTIFKKEIKLKIPFKLKTLRKNHKSFEQCNEMLNISGSHSEGWYVSLSSDMNNTNVYFIWLTRENCQECKWYCRKCEACIHQYSCSCIDNSIRYNMCIHIHALCTFLLCNKLKINPQSNYGEMDEYFNLESLEEISSQLIEPEKNPSKLLVVKYKQPMEK